MDPVSLTLTLVGLALAVLALVPSTLSWLEARKQRRLTERALIVPNGAATPSPAPETRATLRCGIYDYAPLSSWPSQLDSEPSGLLVLLAKEVARDLGLSITFEYFDYQNFYTDVNAIPDIIMGMFETKRRATRVCFTRSIYEIGLQGICRAEQQGNILVGLREGKLKVAVYSGEVGWEFVQDELPDAVSEHRVATLVGGHQLHTMALLNDHAYDVVLMDHLACRNFLNDSENAKRFKLAFDEVPQKYHVCVAVKKEQASILQTIDHTLVRVRNSPEFLQAEQEALKGLEKVVEPRGRRSERGLKKVMRSAKNEARNEVRK